jgi:hypothetical protein
MIFLFGITENDDELAPFIDDGVRDSLNTLLIQAP